MSIGARTLRGTELIIISSIDSTKAEVGLRKLQHLSRLYAPFSSSFGGFGKGRSATSTGGHNFLVIRGVSESKEVDDSLKESLFASRSTEDRGSIVGAVHLPSTSLAKSLAAQACFSEEPR